ncbi:MAG: hypothetical protein E7310_04665 [Clostridiales bacterium]|nr:hypothetical protein [Clostridiales bacterium]
MANKINIDNNELLVLLEFDDSEYEKITMCLNEEDKRVFVINNKIVTDEEIINQINKKYSLELPFEAKSIIKKG